MSLLRIPPPSRPFSGFRRGYPCILLLVLVFLNRFSDCQKNIDFEGGGVSLMISWDSAKRNPSKRGGNPTSKKPETEGFQKLTGLHPFLRKERRKWTLAERERYDDMLQKVSKDNRESIVESWNKKHKLDQE